MIEASSGRRYDPPIETPVGAPSSFAVDLPVYSGPFRLLADLILDHRVDVCDVPLAQVTDRFLELGAAEASSWSLEEATWFVAACAVLLELKVGRLLPRPAAGPEEELLAEVSPDLLYARSLELHAFRMVSSRLEDLAAAAALQYPREAGPPSELTHLYPDVLARVTAKDLGELAATLLAPHPEIDLSHVTPILASVEDALSAIHDRLREAGQAQFRDLLVDCHERIDVVVRFLALLELHRQGKVELSQAELFGDIAVRWREWQPEGGTAP